MRNRNRTFIRFNFREQILSLQILDDTIARRKTIHTGIGVALFVDRTVEIHDVDGRKTVFATDLEVVAVVTRSDFQRSGAEFLLDVFIGDDGYLTVR